MTFYTDKWTITKIDLNNIVLVRKLKNTILLQNIVGDTSIDSKEFLAKDVLDEYDVAVDSPSNIYILYQNQEMHLILTILRGEKREEIKLTSEPITEVFDLNIVAKNKKVHILYHIRIPDKESKYRIYHHYYDGIKWMTYIVEEVIAKRVLNPLRLIQTENKILLSYYSNDNDIELKEFSLDKLEWSDPIKLVDTKSDKVFLDILMVDDIIHLSYCEFIDGNLIIKYEKLLYEKGIINKYGEESISNEGSPSNPTIIFYEGKLWITWVELNKIMSRYSEDKGQSWGSLYMWNDTKNIDFVRYKYLTMILEDNIILDYSFGRIYPEVMFIGFGPTDNAEEIPLKKKRHMNLPRF